MKVKTLMIMNDKIPKMRNGFSNVLSDNEAIGLEKILSKFSDKVINASYHKNKFIAKELFEKQKEKIFNDINKILPIISISKNYQEVDDDNGFIDVVFKRNNKTYFSHLGCWDAGNIKLYTWKLTKVRRVFFIESKNTLRFPK